LAELLDSILAQDSDDLEVVICDDASPDDTKVAAQSYKDKFRAFRFVRHEQNIGLDRNFLSVVENATGEYVWLMGDDDKLEPKGVQKVMETLERWHGISGLVVGVINYNVDFTKRTGLPSLPATQRLQGVASVFRTMVEALGFMSALVIDRTKWMSVVRDGSALHYENYIQVYIVGQIIKRFGDWGVLRTPCVGFRSGNDQLLSKVGWLERLRIDVVGHAQIAGDLFGSQANVLRQVQGRVFRCHVISRILNWKTSQGRTPGPWDTFRLLFQYYGNVPAFWYLGIPMLLIPGAALRGIRKLYKRVPGLSSAARARTLAVRGIES
jgi:hypothetical protein